MQIEIEKRNGVTVVRALEKRIDASVSGELKAKLLEAIQDGSLRIVLDISMVAFIDSSGLGAIISGLKAVGEEGKLVVSGSTENVRAMFKLTRMDRIFSIYDSEEEAVHALMADNG